MSTPHDPTSTSESPSEARAPLRLRLAGHPGQNHLDGGWWPRSRDLPGEVADLVDQFPTGSDQIVRVVYSRPDWEPAPRHIAVDRGYVVADAFPHDDAHLIQLTMSDQRVLHVLVVPPDYSDAHGSEALLAAATRGNAHTASALLDAVRDSPDVSPTDQWNDDGGNWWGEHPVEPSFRTRAERSRARRLG
ncbi:DUF5994 family protein [Solicola gregarius]|uniref:DUF5994 family protein n=1 Tax=Solicola gregarius TaxID=2908642 RepID=A0AA46YJJ3_9ACTN|nr:DUF5994 family protein [Solicola gregarius]UYM03551.1 DUF5994 family protein [Solicola gregarius]